VQLVSKISNLCDPDPPTLQTGGQTDRQTDRGTTCNLNTALCTSASRGKNVARLQRAQNAVARVVAWGTNRQSTSSSALLKHYHWLPIHHRIQFKIACITYKTIHTTQPAYLNSVLEHYTPARTLRSSDTNLLSVPRVRTCFGSRSFSVAAPTIWNSLPSDIRNSCSIQGVLVNLKHSFFQRLAMSSAPSLLPQHLRFGESLADIARFIN